ncbi:MAG TPA: DnaJ domain-containing protein, partial [Coxiellaceae bacterium]|nr:DnaJ domain-containing protein [Coxiellaceae bacterium]
MKNYYEVLNVSADARLDEIKQAYRDLALLNHPDRGGDLEEMKLINLAYEVLSDPLKRGLYDQTIKIQAVEEDLNVDRLKLTESDVGSYSKGYRLGHAKFVRQYSSEPLERRNAKVFFEPFVSKLESQSAKDKVHPPFRIYLTPNLALEVFLNYLEGKYDAEDIETIRQHFLSRLDGMESASTRELSLYRAIFKIITQTFNREISPKLLNSLADITAYAKRAIYAADSLCTRLLSNKNYRDLYAKVLHLYWQSADFSFENELNFFEAKTFTEAHIESLTEELRNIPLLGEKNLEEINKLDRQLRIFKLLLSFDQDLYGESEAEVSAEIYREKAFHILDWIPALARLVDIPVLLNMF